jgi:hypothetical protein
LQSKIYRFFAEKISHLPCKYIALRKAQYIAKKKNSLRELSKIALAILERITRLSSQLSKAPLGLSPKFSQQQAARKI